MPSQSKKQRKRGKKSCSKSDASLGCAERSNGVFSISFHHGLCKFVETVAANQNDHFYESKFVQIDSGNIRTPAGRA